MEPALNPYAPGSGLRPPALMGRDAQVAAFDTVVIRTANGQQNRGMVMSGLRGVGKTVLLNTLKAKADSAAWLSVSIEASPGEVGPRAVRAKLARELLTAARKLNRPGLRERLGVAIGSIGSFSARVGVGGLTLGIEPTKGRADSGELELDLEEMVEDVALAMREQGAGFAIFIDELQDLDRELLSVLLTVQHIAGQREWPFYVIGAGLPSLPAALSGARSYAERLFDYHEIGPLDRQSAEQALVEPAQRAGANYTDQAVSSLVTGAAGYPYFLQQYGKAIWDLAPTEVFTQADAEAALSVGRDQLDQGFFPARWDRATANERTYLRAMADDGEDGSYTVEVAERLGTPLSGLSQVRGRLIAKGLVYVPKRGRVAFTVPGMASYIDRQHGQ
jgi:hypothetical protein